MSHGKLQRQWQISRKRHGRRFAALLESLDGQGFPDARLRRPARAGRLERQRALSSAQHRQGGGALGLRRQAPRRHAAHRAEWPHRTRRHFRLAAGRRAPGQRRPRLAHRVVAAREVARGHRRAAGRRRGDGPALVAGRQAAGRGREERPAHRLRTGGAVKVELRDLTPAERNEVQQRFESLAGKRFAPSPKKPRQEVWWPKAPLDGRAFPEGIQAADGDDAFNESARLLGFLNGVCGGEFYVANLSAPAPYFRHTGKLDADLATWVRTRLVSNPTCLMSATVDVFL